MFGIRGNVVPVNKDSKFRMIDFLKILIFNRELAEVLFNNPLLKNYLFNQSFKNNLNKEVEGINQATYIKEYKEILFCFFIKNDEFTKLEILIKPHYYFNGNLHNANDFTVLECINVLTEIKNTFKLPVEELLVLNIEFGINGISPIDCKDLITYTIYHDKNEFINSSDGLRFSKISFKHDKNGKANNYKKIKFYAKGIQFPDYCDFNTFRFEVKSKRRKYIQKLGIYIYEDLLKTKTYLTLAQNIKKEFSGVLILDIDNKMQNINDREKTKLTEYLNTVKWIKATQGSKNTFNNYKKRYFNLLDKTENNIHNVLENIIVNKLDELLKTCAISTPQKEIKTCAILNHNIMKNGTNNQINNCPVTGLDISMQKKGSFLLSTTGLNYYYKTDEKVFEEVKGKFLTSYWDRADIKTQIKEIYHNIRNKRRNQRDKQERLYTPIQLTLFELS